MNRWDRGEINLVEKWWRDEQTNAAFPGRLTLVFGAGVSMEAPTSLPSGLKLTKALMAHLLDQRACEEILNVYNSCESTIGRSVPRLEHVLDIACNHDAIDEPNEVTPRQLLRLFEGRDPNPQHTAIATYLMKNKGWAITTNFDDCVERASNFTIPVHILNPEKNQMEVISPHPDSGWGLIKVHGTIGGALEGLGATLANIDGGLPQPMRKLLDQVMDGSDLVVVAGYSGSDHFDINRWMAERMNYRKKPKLIWIQHGKEVLDSYIGDDQSEPNVTWRTAFGGMRTLHGPTRDLLSKLLTIEMGQELPQKETDGSLSAELGALYQPSDAQKHLHGAKLAIAMGLGQLAEEELRCAIAKVGRHPVLEELHSDVFEQSGMYREARWLNRFHVRNPNRRKSNHVRIARKSGNKFTALFLSVRLMHAKTSTNHNEKIGTFAEFFHAALDIVERWQRVFFFRTKIIRWLFLKGIAFFWHLCPDQDAPLQANLIGRLQQLQLRQRVLLEDLDDELIGSILIEVMDQASHPDFYTKDGPLIPGYFLTQLSTLKELDQLSELVRAYLELAKLLSTLYARFQNIRRPHHMRSTLEMRSDMIYRLVMRFFENARDIAIGLGEPHLQVEVAQVLLQINAAMRGLAYLRPQRLCFARNDPSVKNY
jgi:hypothetical protein